jgi:plastocyanin
MHRFLLIALSIAIAIASTNASATSTATVEITRFTFQPKEITVAPGTTIVWTNHDETPHTVTSADKVLASKAMDTDDIYQHTFNDEGDVAYFCTVHPFMTGIVHVRRP